MQWRPFTNILVSHTFDEFRKKYDKGLILNSQSPKKNNDKQDLLPFKVTESDVEMRLKSFRELQDKVGKQRESIKKRDLSFETRNKAIEKMKKKERDEIRNEIRGKMSDVREMNAKGYKERYKSMGAIKGSTFEMTQVYSEETVKMPPIGNKMRNLTFLEE